MTDKLCQSVNLSVIIAACNEEKNIQKRIENILSCDYPKKDIEIIVVSDGSNDNTNLIVQQLSNQNHHIKLLTTDQQYGRANAHNTGVNHSTGDILIFTDADTIFEKDFIHKIVCPFADKKVGFVSGRLIFQNQCDNTVTQSAGIYWNFEMWLRKQESESGILAFGSGACSAVRKELYKTIPPTGDEDFTTPLDVVLQEYRCIHLEDAIAHDTMPGSPEKELKARIRMTAKNFHGTVTRWGFVNILKHPIYTWIIFSHKIGRWLTPFALIGLFISSLFLSFQNMIFFTQLMLAGQVIFYVLALLGYLSVKIPLASQAYSFVLANIGFFIGVINALTGRVPSSYVPLNKQ